MIRLSDIDRWDREESDRLRPSGQDPVDDLLEDRAREAAAADRAFEHAPTLGAVVPPAGIAMEQPAPRERREHRQAGRARWTRCECGAWEKGYRHPGHRYGCPRYARRDEIGEAA